jgi:hypothetical protein
VGEDLAETNREIAIRHAQYVEELADADRHLDVYLQANATACGRSLPAQEQSLVDSPGASDVISEAEWVIRPMLMSDQPALRQAYHDIFDYSDNLDVLVMHPVGTDDPIGVLTIRPKDDLGEDVDVNLRVGRKGGAETGDAVLEYMERRLLRASIARAAAGGAKRVSYVASTKDVTLAPYQRQLGFNASSPQSVWRLNMAAVRDRCLGLFERYRRRKRIPDDVQLLPLERVPHNRVDHFLRQFFSDGAAAPSSRLDGRISHVMFKGSEIVASLVGHRRGADTFVTTRLGVLEKFRGLWVTPWLLGVSCREGCELGCQISEFYIDEARYPDFAKIARSMDADLLDEVITMTLELQVPWQGA